MKKSFFALLAFVGIIPAFACGQNSSWELVFTAVNNTVTVQLDSIRIINRTQGGDTTLHYPDTVLMLDYSVNVAETGVTDDAFHVFQNYPNPVKHQTTISVTIPEKEQVTVFITDVLGRSVMQTERVLDRGAHSFRFTPG